TVCWKRVTHANPFEEVKDLKGYWENLGQTNENWKAPDGLFWICGKRAYNELSKRWRGTCTIGIIQPAFFLLPKSKGEYLG
ncbi:ENR1 protein, partial [Urocynchramus pylzowi]|nr:ENR1 protein [Urocynchramus pylzowi]